MLCAVVWDTLSDIIVIDDGSTDRTSAEAAAAGATVIRHERNLGKGVALNICSNMRGTSFRLSDHYGC